MKLRDFGLLTDENVDPQVISFLRAEGFDVSDICEAHAQGMPDTEILRNALLENRLVLTHDSDFGSLAMLDAEPLVGIVFLRPGHIDSQFTIGTIKALLQKDLNVEPPFIIVAKRSKNRVVIRIRRVGNSE